MEGFSVYLTYLRIIQNIIARVNNRGVNRMSPLIVLCWILNSRLFLACEAFVIQENVTVESPYIIM